jgi:hypothetical protein
MLLAGVASTTYVPKVAEKDYASALRMEYARYNRRKQRGKAMVAPRLWYWRGYPREQIPWFPTISEENSVITVGLLGNLRSRGL